MTINWVTNGWKITSKGHWSSNISPQWSKTVNSHSWGWQICSYTFSGQKKVGHSCSIRSNDNFRRNGTILVPTKCVVNLPKNTMLKHYFWPRTRNRVSRDLQFAYHRLQVEFRCSSLYQRTWPWLDMSFVGCLKVTKSDSPKRGRISEIIILSNFRNI